jgi:DedD protein
MADQSLAPHEQQLKQRAMRRRLAVALTLIALAIAGVALLDRYRASLRKPEVPSAPTTPQALPGEPAMRMATPPQTAEPATSQPTQRPEQPARRPPPPPPVGSNEPLPAAESVRPAAQAATDLPEDTGPPLTRDPSAPAKAAEPQTAKGFVVQVGVFSTAEHAHALQAKLAEKGIPSHAETRVVIGPFKDRADADAVTRQIREVGLEGVVVAPR